VVSIYHPLFNQYVILGLGHLDVVERELVTLVFHIGRKVLLLLSFRFVVDVVLTHFNETNEASLLLGEEGHQLPLDHLPKVLPLRLLIEADHGVSEDWCIVKKFLSVILNLASLDVYNVLDFLYLGLTRLYGLPFSGE
jgi:hypothetical protein